MESPPLGPEDALNSIRVPEGYTVDLVAAEPLVLDPVAFDWDAEGRLWVVEMADYPLGLDNNQAAGGRIRVLEDIDGDGTMDRSSLFAEGLNFPNGILHWRDGVIVTAAPDVLYLRDTNGDGRADQQEVLLTGLTEGNQQLRANGLRWGLDNWVYVAAGGHHGNYGVDTTIRSSRTGLDVKVGSRDFRFRPDTGELEPQSGPSQFGRNRDDWGNWFGTQNSRPLWHYVLPDHYVRRNPWFSPAETRVLLPNEVNPPVYPAKPPQKRFHNFQQSGRFTSACSGMIYRDNRLFDDEAVNGFSCEPFHNLVQRIRLTPDGVTFHGERAGGDNEPDFFASSDRWCRPVMARTGPDGALWIADMYRYMIEHPQWLPEEGKQELLPHYRAGEDRGRIYRIRKTDEQPVLPFPFRKTGLIAQLASRNGWVRDKAHQMLVWEHDLSRVPALKRLAAIATEPRVRLQALCTLDGLNALPEELLLQALGDPHPEVRKNALRLAESRLSPVIESAVLALRDDPDPRVRLQLAFTLGAFPASSETAAVLASLLNSRDAFLEAAVLGSVVPHFSEVLGQLPRQTLARLHRPLAEIALGGGNPQAMAGLLYAVIEDHPLLLSLLDVLHARDIRVDALGDDLLTDAFMAAVDEAKVQLDNGSAPLDKRVEAAALLARVEQHHESAIRFLSENIKPSIAPDDLEAILETLGGTGAAEVPRILLEKLTELPPRARSLAIQLLLTRQAWTRVLLSAFQDGRLSPSLLDPAQKNRLENHPNRDIRERAGRLLTRESTRSEVVEAYQPALDRSGDVREGREVFEQSCVACHRRGDLGTLDLGPNLASVVEHPAEKLLANILDPNLDIQPGYHAYYCDLKTGEQLYGLITAETASGITLRQADGRSRTLLRSDIASLKSSNVSLMPEGLEAAINLRQMADLIAFLKDTGSL